jgi:pyruvate-formate lyase-activating enzyme
MRYELTKMSTGIANFSVIMPGACNAACGFCFWKRSSAENPMFAQHLAWYLTVLDTKVTQISLTGGEPTLSPFFDDVLQALRNYAPNKKVVMTTNGVGLKEKLSSIAGVVRYLNISRHAVGDKENCAIFRTGTVPSAHELEGLCDTANGLGIEVTINKVLPHDYSDMAEFRSFVTFAKQVGASALALRKDYAIDSLDKTPLENSLGVAAVERSCPVCVTNSYLFRGLPIHFKMSLEEPSNTLPYIYEFIYHPNGALTEDWAGEKPIKIVAVAETKPLTASIRQRQTHVGGCAQTAGGCGQSSSRC